MYPRLSSNKAIMVRDEIDSARTNGVPLDDLLKQDFKNLLSIVENGESLVETSIEDLYFQADAMRQNFANKGLVANRKTGAVKEATTRGEYLEELMAEHLHRTLEIRPTCSARSWILAIFSTLSLPLVSFGTRTRNATQ